MNNELEKLLRPEDELGHCPEIGYFNGSLGKPLKGF